MVNITDLDIAQNVVYIAENDVIIC